MKKLKSFILLICCLFSLGVFFACDVKGSVSFEKEEIEIVKGQLYDLNDIIKLEDATLSDVTFKSSDNSIAYVTPEYKVGGISEGRVLITADCGDTHASFTVNVLPEIVYLDSPLGLRYDLKEKAVVWNEVFAKVGDEVFAANSYTVWVQKDNETPVEYDNILTPKFAIENEGTYTVKVKTNDRSSVIRGSSYSDSIVVKKLAAPTNVEFDAETSILSWESSANEFAVSVNGVRLLTTNKSYLLNLDNEGTYLLSVIALDSTGAVVEAESDTLTVTRLETPTLACQSGRLNWNVQNGVEFYDVIISSELNPDEHRRVSGDIGTYTLEGLTAGNYSVQIIAYPKDNYLKSGTSNSVSVKKLATPIISFNDVTKTFKVADTLSNDTEFTIEKQNGEKTYVTVNAQNNYEFAWSESQATTYRVYAKVVASTSEIVSDTSNVITITQLAKASNVAHSTSNEKSYLSFNEVNNANHYEIEINGEGLKTLESYSSEPVELGLTDDIFNTAKAYTVRLISSSTLSSASHYILSSEENLTITRLSNVSNLKFDDDTKVITWSNVSGKSNYKYSIFKDGEELENDIFTDIVSLNVSTYSFGNYEFKIKALGNGTSTLDSLNYTSVTFSLDERLASPTLSFNRENKTLSGATVLNATEYEIQLDGERILLLLPEQIEEIDVSSYFTEEKIYSFSIIARNAQNDLLLDSVSSQSSTVNVEKLKRPTNIAITTSENVLVSDYEDQTKLDSSKFTLLVNGEEVSSLDDKQSFEIKVNYNAKTTPVGNNYYLDSEVSVFNVNRLATPSKPVFENQNISWSRLDNGVSYDCVILIEQDKTTFSINMTNKETIEATNNLIASRIDVAKPYSIKLQYRTSRVEVTSSSYISSSYSEELIVQRLGLVRNLKVIGTESDIEIVWDIVENVSSYTLTITKPDSSTEKIVQNTNTYSAFKFKEAGVYSVKVEAKNPDYIDPPSATVVRVERLTQPTGVNVSSGEVFTINTIPSQSKLEEVLVEIDTGSGKQKIENEVNFSEITTDFDVYVTFKAVQNDANEFYLSSETSKFIFERISPMMPVEILDGKISWITSEEADGYSLKFTKLGKEARYITISDKDIGSIKLDSSEVLRILDYYGSGEAKVSVKAIKNAITGLTIETIGYLSCSTYSNETSLTKLPAPTNVEISAADGDKVQTSLTVSWQHTEQAKTDKYEIYVNGALIKTVTGLTCSIDDAFTAAGEYNLQVKAVGSDSNISSSLSESITFKRLRNPAQVSVNKNAVLSWQNISNSSSYVVYYTLPGGIEQEVEATNPFNLSSILANGEDKFSGVTIVSVRAVGDGVATFSSAKSTAYNVVVLDKPNIELSTDRFSINGNFDSSFSAKAIVTLKQIVGEDYKVIMNSEEINFNTAYYYPSLEAGNYVIEAYAMSQLSNGYVSSALAKAEFTKLTPSQEMYFSKNVSSSNNSTSLSFYALCVENASGYVLSVEDYTTSSYVSQTIDSKDYISYNNVNDIIDRVASGMISFKVKAIGGEKNGKFYINSEYAIISTRVLAQVKNISTLLGELTFTEDLYATGYNLIVNGKYEYITSLSDLEEILFDYEGVLSINVRALGNVGEKTSQNVILDGSFNGTYENETFTLKNYTATKLTTPAYFSVNEGYISALKEANTTGYKFLIDGKIYDDVVTFKEEIIKEQTYNLLISDKMYSKLSTDTSYELKIRATSGNQNVINSNWTNHIKIKIPSGVGEIEWNLREKVDSDSKTYYDLTQTYLEWADKETGNGYLIKLNNEVRTSDVNQWTVPENSDGGSFTLAVAIRGASEVDESGDYILNSIYSETYTYYILGESRIEIKDGIITWDIVENATGYYVYLNGNVYNNEALTTTSLDISTAGDYTVSVQAVCLLENYFAGKIVNYSEIKNDEEVDIIVKKLSNPNKFSIENGRLYWTEGLEALKGKTLFDFAQLSSVPDEEMAEKFAELTLTNSPYTFDLTDMSDHNLVLRFRTGDSYYEVETKAFQFLTPKEDELTLAESLCSLAGKGDAFNLFLETMNDPTGWPTNMVMFDTYASKIPAGEYNLTVRQNGNNYNYLNSIFNSNFNLYVPGAPKINISYIDGEYYLNWNSVTIPNKFRDGETKYTIYGDKDEENKQIVIASDITANTFNLSSLIESGVLNEEFTKIYVAVQGNSVNILNGKTSAKIDIEVLTKISARVVEGEIQWDSQASASAYEIIFTGGAENVTKILNTPENYWIGEELEEGYTYSDVTIRALGTQYVAKEKIVLAGPVTNIGTLTKLVRPNWYIENGLVKWNDIENSSSYISKYYEGLNGDLANDPTGTQTIIKDGEVLNYVSSLAGEITYFLKTIGTPQQILSDETTSYINSDFAMPLYSFKHDSITNITCNAGELNWDSLRYNNELIKNYLLIFKREGVADIEIDIQNIQTMRYDGYSVSYSYDGKEYEYLIADDYTVTIQGYSKGLSTNTASQDSNFYVTSGTKIVYVLRSLVQSSPVEVSKLTQPTNLAVYSGKVVWEDATSTEESIFELSFTGQSAGVTKITNRDEERVNEFTFNAGVWTWSGSIDLDLENFDASTYTLRVRRLAANSSEMNSNYTDYRTIIEDTEGEFITVTQLNAIRDEQVKIALIDILGIDKYVITWEDYVPANVEDSQVSYLFEYYTTLSSSQEQPEIKQILIDNGNKYVVYEDIEQGHGTDLLVYRIRVISGRGETRLNNYLNSRFTKEFTIEKPKSVETITFNTKTQVYEWTYNNSDKNQNLEFIINDYFIPNGQIVPEGTDMDIYDEYKNTYFISVLAGENTYEFAPLQIGTHVISVEVSITNASSTDATAFKSGAIFYLNTDYNKYSEVFNLFDSGEGTVQNPYIIANETQFNNVRYRKDMLSYITQPLSFKQSAHISLNGSIETTESETIYKGFIDGEFNAKYNGDFYSLTLVTSLVDLNANGGLFNKIGAKGEISNLHLLVTLTTNSISTQISLGLLAKENSGTITNCLIGDKLVSRTITIASISATTQISGLVNKNYGTVELCENFYNFSVVDDGVNNFSVINIGGLVYENSAIVRKCGNRGSILVGSSTQIGTREGTVVGGIVARQTSSGGITDSFNRGEILISYSSDSRTYYVGGIVGSIEASGSAGGNLRNCYAYGTINVYHNNTNPTAVNIGGLVGRSKDAKYINNSYSNVKLSVQQASGVTITAVISTIVGYTEVNNNENLTCYSLASEGLAGGSGLKTYTAKTLAIALGVMNDNDGVTSDTFDEDALNNPKFVWENSYDSIVWKV